MIVFKVEVSPAAVVVNVVGACVEEVSVSNVSMTVLCTAVVVELLVSTADPMDEGASVVG